MAAPPPFRILSLDGGGVRGILQACLLSRLSQTFPQLISEVDMFAGTSAGSIVTMALLGGLSPQETIEFWKKEVGSIFYEGVISKFTSLDNCIGAAYKSDSLKTSLFNILGNKSLRDVPKKVLFPTFQLGPRDGSKIQRWHPEFFHNFEGSRNADATLVDVCLRTTAAPTYFPIYQGYVDGGTFANDPSLSAVSTAANHAIDLSRISVLSISTGSNPKCLMPQDYGTGNWGLFEWAPNIIDLLLDSNTESIGYQCRCFLQSRYYRLDPQLPCEFSLDDISAIPKLIELANTIDLKDTEDFLRKYWLLKDGQQALPVQPTKPAAYSCNLM